MEDHGVVRVVHLERPQLHIRNNPSLTAPSEVFLSLSLTVLSSRQAPRSRPHGLYSSRRAGEEWMLVLSEGQELIAQIGPLSVGVYVLCS